MKEPDWERCTEEELWKYVATHLSKNGIDTILVGGAVVSIYTEGAYRSGDLDFVQLSYLTKKLPELMRGIGFEIRHGRHYSHPLCKHLIIEFASGPTGIGEDLNITPHKVKVEGTTIKIYSPTDCIRDRLASFIHFKALECLDQAALVAQKHPHDRIKIKKWCTNERAPGAFAAFKDKVKTLALNKKNTHPDKKKPPPTPNIPIHPWRSCPYGQHAVVTHPMHVPPSKNHPNGITTRHFHCARNPSGKDELRPDEIKDIGEQHFSDLKSKPCPLALGFESGGKYDNLIAGWTKYWNDILKPKEPLDPNLVKALIATESRFIPNLLADKKKQNSARGLMQITNGTRRILENPKGEIKDHYIIVTREELNDPCVNICAGIRWLFRKRDWASNDLGHEASWEEAVSAYKGTSVTTKKRAKELMDKFKEKYEALKKCKKPY